MSFCDFVCFIFGSVIGLILGSGLWKLRHYLRVKAGIERKMENGKTY